MFKCLFTNSLHFSKYKCETGEEEKSEKEPLKIWGKIEGDVIVDAKRPNFTAQCLRVPVTNGHMGATFVRFENKPTKEQILDI